MRQLDLYPPRMQERGVSYSSQATACLDYGEASALQFQANYGGTRRFLRLWMLSVDTLKDEPTIVQGTIADYLPNEGDLQHLVRDAKKWASGKGVSLLIADRRLLYAILSPGFALGVFNVATKKYRLIDWGKEVALQKPVSSFPDDTVIVIARRQELARPAFQWGDSELGTASGEVHAWMMRSAGSGPVGLLHLRAPSSTGGQARSGITAIESDRGLVKDANEDSATVMSFSHSAGGRTTSTRVISVADGVGGAAYGEIASKIASSAAPAVIGRSILEGTIGDAEKTMISAFDAANEKVESVAAYASKSMASTLTCSLIAENHFRIAYAGDTRVYEVDPRASAIMKLTEDHRLSQDGVASHVITRAIGSRNPSPDIGPEKGLHPGNILLHCTDGLHDMVSDDEIFEVCATSATPRELASRLVGLANSKGGHDNITVAAHYM